MARQHLPLVERLLRADHGFSSITVGVGTGGGGCILVVGNVALQGDLHRLQATVAATKPPVEVVYVVRLQ